MADKKPSLIMTSREVRMTFCSKWEQMLFTEEERAVAQLFYSLCCHFGASNRITDQGGEFVQ